MFNQSLGDQWGNKNTADKEEKTKNVQTIIVADRALYCMNYYLNMIF